MTITTDRVHEIFESLANETFAPAPGAPTA
jgi:hypothetical protein